MNDHSNERAVLECIAQYPSWTLARASQLGPELFSREDYRLVFEAIVECGREWNMTKVVQRLLLNGTLEKAGGAAIVSDIWVGVAPFSMADYYLQRAREDAVLRRCHAAAQQAVEQLAQALRQGTEDAAALLDEIVEKIHSAGNLPGKRAERMTMREAMGKLLADVEVRSQNPGVLPGISTGFPQLDRISNGLQEGHLWVIAGLPGDGKSTLMQNITEGAAKDGAKVGIYQLEMPIEEQAFRYLASDSMVDSDRLWWGNLHPGEFAQIQVSVARLKDAGVEFIRTDDMSADDILADIENADYRVGMVDYLQLLEIRQAKGETREQALSTVARKMKRIAKQKGMTLLTGSQVNDDGKLRESRAIGQHADKVFFVAREDEDDHGRRVVQVGKNRGGRPGGRIPMLFLGSIYQFREDDRHDNE